MSKFIFPESFTISQSFLKDYSDYKNDNLPASTRKCGLQLKASYIDRLSYEGTDLMRLGVYFEYLCTGAIPRSGEIPKPDTTKAGELTAPYKKIAEQAKTYHRIMEKYGFKVIEANCTIIIEELKTKGVIDIVAERDGKICYIDLKTSGMLNNKWEEMGWETNTLQYKDKIMVQAVQYKMLGLHKYGYEPDFYFFVFSNTNEIEAKIIKVILDDNRIDEHIQVVKNARKMFISEAQRGFTPYPDIKKCHDCFVKDTCPAFTDTPLIEDVYY